VARLGDHRLEFGVFLFLFLLVAALGMLAARWRRPASFNDLDSWGLGNRSFGPYVSWFLLGGDLYTAYTFIAVPTLMYGVGAAGFFAVPFAVVAYPVAFLALSRMWSVSHVHGLVTPADFVRARFGSRGLALLVAVTGIAATMPYIAVQLIGVEAVFEAIGVPGKWPLVVAFVVLAVFTWHSGLRAPALIAFVKDILLVYVVFAILVTIAMSWNAWHGVFGAAAQHFAATPSRADGLLVPVNGQLGYVSLAVGSALALFLYPHAITGVLAARSRGTVRRSLAALPVYTLMLGLLALLGFVAIAWQVKPIAGDRNTVVPVLLHQFLPDWFAGLGYAAVGVGALVPASVMSIAAANLFARNIYREYLRPHASLIEELRIGRTVSVLVKLGAVLFIVALDPQFSIDLQLIGGVLILQTLPAVGLGLYTNWFHRYALFGGMAAGLLTGVGLLYLTPQLAPNGATVRAHFGGSAWPLARWGIHSGQSVYIGLIAVAVNIATVIALTIILRARRVPDGIDITWNRDYEADEGDPSVRRLAELVDGGPTNPAVFQAALARHGRSIDEPTAPNGVPVVRHASTVPETPYAEPAGGRLIDGRDRFGVRHPGAGARTPPRP
jgi:solute:Na+ symporter, SSS family